MGVYTFARSQKDSVWAFAYLRDVKKILNNSKEKSGAKHLQILAAITKLRQLACNPKLVMPDTSVESSKMLDRKLILINI